jgi:hypothetical protein
MGTTRKQLTATIAVLSAALALAGAAAAEMPRNTALPEITGPNVTGYALVGHNGTWLYADGTGCGPECSYSFAWQRCGPDGCALIEEARERVYRLGRVDLGSQIRLIVTTTKYDCGEWNYAAGTRECRFVSRASESEATPAIVRGVVRADALVRSARLVIEEIQSIPRRPRPNRPFALRVTVTDAFGRHVAGARVSAGGRVASTSREGVAVVRISPSRRVVVAVATGARRPVTKRVFTPPF